MCVDFIGCFTVLNLHAIGIMCVCLKHFCSYRYHWYHKQKYQGAILIPSNNIDPKQSEQIHLILGKSANSQIILSIFNGYYASIPISYILFFTLNIWFLQRRNFQKHKIKRRKYKKQNQFKEISLYIFCVCHW